MCALRGSTYYREGCLLDHIPCPTGCAQRDCVGGLPPLKEGEKEAAKKRHMATTGLSHRALSLQPVTLHAVECNTIHHFTDCGVVAVCLWPHACGGGCV